MPVAYIYISQHGILIDVGTTGGKLDGVRWYDMCIQTLGSFLTQNI